MIKCTLNDGSIRFFNCDVVHNISQDADGDGLVVTFTKAGSAEVARQKITSFMIVKSGTTYK